jgi:hypothetical protein
MREILTSAEASALSQFCHPPGGNNNVSEMRNSHSKPPDPNHCAIVTLNRLRYGTEACSERDARNTPGDRMLSRRSGIRRQLPSLPLSLCWRQLGQIRRLLKTAAPSPIGRGPSAWSGIGSKRVRSSAVTTANRPFVNFKRVWRSCGNSSKETPTAAPKRRPERRRSGNRRRRVKRPVRLSSRVRSPPSMFMRSQI